MNQKVDEHGKNPGISWNLHFQSFLKIWLQCLCSASRSSYSVLLKIHQRNCAYSLSVLHDHPPATQSHCWPMGKNHHFPSLCKKVSCIPSVSGPVLPHIDPIHHLGFDQSAWTSNRKTSFWQLVNYKETCTCIYILFIYKTYLCIVQYGLTLFCSINLRLCKNDIGPST